jgi:hypothetical protein
MEESVDLKIALSPAASSFLHRLRLHARKAKINQFDHPTGNERETQLTQSKIQILT